jgi:hypothetical protein
MTKYARSVRWLALAGLGLSGATLPGCAVGALVGGMMESARRESNRTVEAEYKGLTDETFAVLVAAPAVVQAEYPELVQRVTLQVSAMLAQNAGAAGFVPGVRVLEYTFNRPGWVAKPLDEIAKDLGVSRVVFVDLTEYRLHDKGNSYLWDGAAAATLGIVEADSALSSDFVFQRSVSVKFPDQSGYGQAELPAAAVNTELTRRLCERLAWLLYQHEEPYYPKY